jgi:hypothetical protein
MPDILPVASEIENFGATPLATFDDIPAHAHEPIRPTASAPPTIEAVDFNMAFALADNPRLFFFDPSRNIPKAPPIP